MSCENGDQCCRSAKYSLSSLVMMLPGMQSFFRPWIHAPAVPGRQPIKVACCIACKTRMPLPTCSSAKVRSKEVNAWLALWYGSSLVCWIAWSSSSEPLGDRMPGSQWPFVALAALQCTQCQTIVTLAYAAAFYDMFVDLQHAGLQLRQHEAHVSWLACSQTDRQAIELSMPACMSTAQRRYNQMRDDQIWMV